MEQVQLQNFKDALRRKIEGDLLFDEMSCLLYSTDASLYEIKPLGIVLPRTREDIVQAVRTAIKYRVPVLPRGGGTSLAGQTVTSGLVVDCSKYLTRILEVNETEGWARVQPGVVRDNLNDFLKSHHLHFAPDVSTSSRANIGGMIGNNSAGVRSILYGKTVDHVLELTVILSTGEELLLQAVDAQQLSEKCSQEDREGDIYRGVCSIVSENRDEIVRRYPKVMRRVGGYNLDELLDKNIFNLAKLMVGSEGTLAFVVEAKINLEPLPKTSVVSVLHFDDLIEAVSAVPIITQHQPSAIEIMDSYGLELAFSNPAIAPLCSQFVQGKPQAILVVEFGGESEAEIRPRWAQMKEALEKETTVYAFYDAWESTSQQTVWDVRKHALGILLGMQGDAKPLPFIEDAGIPVQHLSQYISKVLKICQSHNRPVALYAHASAGVIHVRPILNLKQTEDVHILQAISSEVFDLVRSYGGSWSGEHGDGLVRSYKNKEFFGDQLYQAFRTTKQIFDPSGLMNPGKIIDSQDIAENLRIHPGYHADTPPSHFRFAQEQGFDRAVEMCTGVGHCRKTLSGTMCPSYMATREEEHSTRGRANALRMAMSGRFGLRGLTSHRLHNVLDLCLECKACKSECPSKVDMARLKAEFLAHYYEEHGLPLGKKLFSNVRETARLASHLPSLSNSILKNRFSRWLLEKVAGIDQRRVPPLVAGQTLTGWFADNKPPADSEKGQPVALFVDTFINFYEPHIGIAAIQLLRKLKCEIRLVDAGCCGRPLISAGQLATAKNQGRKLIGNLQELAKQLIPIIVLEPSCLSTLRDDYIDLMDDEALCRQVLPHVLSLEEFLTSARMKTGFSQAIGVGPARILFHGHCQQKALFGTGTSLQALSALKETQLVEIDSGCCGMAGSFGYEKSHYGISEQIGDLRLFPAVRAASPETELVASGFSCRSQIQHFTGRRARHLAEVLAEHSK